MGGLRTADFGPVVRTGLGEAEETATSAPDPRSKNGAALNLVARVFKKFVLFEPSRAKGATFVSSYCTSVLDSNEKYILSIRSTFGSWKSLIEASRVVGSGSSSGLSFKIEMAVLLIPNVVVFFI